MAIATIGSMPVTIENRSLHIDMERKLKSERVVRFTDSAAEKLRGGLACKVARFAADNFKALEKSDPVIAENLSNRKADNWRPLFAVADLAGAAWPKLARDIAAGTVAAAEDQTIPTQLLSDLRDMFAALKTNGDLFGDAYDSIIPKPFGSERPFRHPDTEIERAWSRDIAVYLNSIADRPWANWNRGKGISASDLTKRLKDYKIHSKDIGVGQAHAKGYYANQFDDAFSRYLGQFKSDGSDKSNYDS
jgi:putative DNA primase/helicase